MKTIITAVVCISLLILVLAGCGPQVPSQTFATIAPTPCATPGAASGVNSSSSGTVGTAARTTPAAISSTVSPDGQPYPSAQELATREAVLARTNGSGPTLPAGQPYPSALSLCPTPTPQK